MFFELIDRHPRFMLLVHLLAVIDALLVPGLVLWWFARQGPMGGPLGVPVAVIMTIWGGRRLVKALFAVDEYSWMVLKVGKWGLYLIAIGVIGKVWYLATR